MSLKNKEIQLLWNDFRKGDESAFSMLFETFFDDLYRYGMKFASDDSEVKDCIQELFIKLHTIKSTLPEVNNPKYYLLRSLKNTILDYKKKNQKMKYLSLHDLPFTIEYVTEEYEEHDERLEKLEKLLSLLNKRQKEAIYLRFQMGLSYEEISDILEIKYQSTRNLIHRSLQKIREHMDITLFIVMFTQVRM